MSDGPITKWRDAHVSPDVSTPNTHRVCFAVEGHAYCGRTDPKLTSTWQNVVCADCEAAYRADMETK